MFKGELLNFAGVYLWVFTDVYVHNLCPKGDTEKGTMKIGVKIGQDCVSLPSRQLSVGSLTPQEPRVFVRRFGNL